MWTKTRREMKHRGFGKVSRGNVPNSAFRQDHRNSRRIRPQVLEAGWRRRHPYALVNHRGAQYVIGWSKDHNAIRVSKVDRISAVDVLQLQFERPGDFDAEKFLAHSFGIFAGDGAPQTIRVRFAAPVIRILEEKRFYRSQRLIHQSDGSVVAEYDLASFEEFTSWVLSFGPQAEVLEPEPARQNVATALNSALSAYLDGNGTQSRIENAELPTRRAK